MDNNFFTAIEEEQDEIIEEKELQEEILDTAFIKGLPDWDLTPPYEIIQRGDSK